MGSFEGAEVCELVGLYIRSVLSRKYGKSQIGLYQDDGLAAFRSNSQTSDRIRKEITNCFKDQGLNITIQANLKEVKSLMSPSTSRQIPTNSTRNLPTTLSTSTQNPTIIKQHPKNISKRISDISSRNEIFVKPAPYFNNALNITWFNPPYCKNVQTNVAYKFLRLLDKHFPKNPWPENCDIEPALRPAVKRMGIKYCVKVVFTS